ncbi:N-formylglutamate amidohydrolase [Parerythrobacter lacustris]|uniref:N-formylglutamate amidohydrolase n=1 Tax=Parerythrobacter lacustris TaxID=2969984 RepID=A0ABT1XSB6_9SPHN|nr:N-formylglutamate amidohydrolase [Parerythrobacter lacustris]MCR2834551.1 N-formylglutamate amidohydrolase [Parerythrobacter lacustris]
MTGTAQNSGDSISHRGGNIPGTRKPAYSLTLSGELPVPVILAVPHAGRSYPDGLWKRMRRPEWSALRLEDRFVDRIAAEVARQTGAGLLVSHAPRALIDLNRATDDVDWTMVAEGAPSGSATPKPNQRARSGLGLVPRRLPGLGEIWSGPMSGSELDARIGQVHLPYHRALEGALESARDRWGAALLLDLHSMPPLKPAHPRDRVAEFVVGDRFGASADDRLVACTLRELAQNGAMVAHNRPYAGGYVLDRHANLRTGVHAIQIEICRSLYLSDDLLETTGGLGEVAATLSRLIRVLAGEVATFGRIRDMPLAAE